MPVLSPERSSELHILLPSDPCYAHAMAGPSAGVPPPSAEVAADRTQWHRMVKSKDPAEATTQIFRPQAMHLRTPPPTSDQRSKL